MHDKTREEAINLIYAHLENLTNEELGDVMGSMFGDSVESLIGVIPYHGANFTVHDKDDLRFDEYSNLKDECKWCQKDILEQ